MPLALIMLVAGLILHFAGQTWFTGAETTAIILIIVGGVLLLFAWAGGIAMMRKVK